MANKNTIKGLGRKEAGLVARLMYENKKIITTEEIDNYLPEGYKYRRQLVYSLKKKSILSPIKRGVYVFTPLDSVPTGIRINEFLIPAVFFPENNYYIGYSTMFSYYGFTEQVFQTVYVLNTTICREKDIRGVTYKFVKVPENRIYGVDTIRVEGMEVFVSSKERTLVDLIYFNKPVGGSLPALRIFKRIIRGNGYDIKKFIQYASRFPNVTTRKRIGLELERMNISRLILKPLRESIKDTAISSFNSSRKGSINKTWRVIINDPRR